MQDISEKVGNSEIVRGGRGKKSKKNKINSFISKLWERMEISVA